MPVGVSNTEIGRGEIGFRPQFPVVVRAAIVGASLGDQMVRLSKAAERARRREKKRREIAELERQAMKIRAAERAAALARRRRTSPN